MAQGHPAAEAELRTARATLEEPPLAISHTSAFPVPLGDPTRAGDHPLSWVPDEAAPGTIARQGPSRAPLALPLVERLSHGPQCSVG